MTARRARPFRAYCVGLPKTGTTSVGTIFENYRSVKIAGSELEQLGCDVRDDRRALEAARAFVHRRDEEEWLEMDPSSANWMILGVLKEEFPDARFVLTLRDCYSWCDSMLNVLVGRQIGQDFIDRPDLFRRVLGCELEWFRDVDTVLRRADEIFEKLLRFWGQQALTAQACPASRTLVVRTADISSSVDALASFVGVPPSTLLPERTHSRQAPLKYDIMKRVDRDLLASAFAASADSAVMKDYFPAASLAAFLDRDAAKLPRATPAISAGSRVDEPDAIASHSYPVGYWLSAAATAAANGEVAAAERALDEARRLPLEPDEERRVTTVRAILKRVPTDAADAAPPCSGGGSSPTGDVREIAEALSTIRAPSAQRAFERLGYRLRNDALRTRGSTAYALLAFSRRHGALVLELGLRRDFGGHWVASERFAVSYRRSALTILQSDLRLAETLLELIERQPDAEGETHGPT